MKTLTKRSESLTLWDRLSRLNFEQATKLLGPRARKLILKGKSAWEFDLKECVYFQGDLFRLKFPADDGEKPPVVTITLRSDARQRLHWNCTHCDTPCQ